MGARSALLSLRTGPAWVQQSHPRTSAWVRQCALTWVRTGALMEAFMGAYGRTP